MYIILVFTSNGTRPIPWRAGPVLRPTVDCRHTFEVAPVFILVEHFVIARLVKLFGWLEGDGIFSPGKEVHFLGS